MTKSTSRSKPALGNPVRVHEGQFKSAPVPNVQNLPSAPPRGFAAMSTERQHALAALGGRSVPDEKRSFSLDHDLAVRAGRKGGKSVRRENRRLFKDPDLAREIGRKGGLAAQAKKRQEP